MLSFLSTVMREQLTVHHDSIPYKVITIVLVHACHFVRSVSLAYGTAHVQIYS